MKNKWFKSIGLIAVLVLGHGLFSGLLAQDYSFGVKIGFSVVTQTGNFAYADGEVDLELESGFMAGYSFGVVSRLTLGSNWNLLTELNYSRFGASYDDSFQFQNQQIFAVGKTRINYIQVPVMVDWQTGPPDLGPYRYQRPYISWHARGGLYGGYRVNARFSGTNTAQILGVDFESEFSNDVTDTFQAFDFGLTAGGAVEYGLRQKFGFETRLVLGMLNAGTNMDSRNMGLVFGFYWMI